MTTEKSKQNRYRNIVEMWNSVQLSWLTQSLLESSAIESDSLVEEDQKVDSRKNYCSLDMEQEYGRHQLLTLNKFEVR